jgi:hypothetical protein
VTLLPTPASVSRRRRRWLLLPIVVLALGATSAAFGHGSRDQANDVLSTGSVDCGGYGRSLFQTFLPSSRLLSSVDLWFRAGREFPAAGTTLQIKIQTEAGPSRTALAETSITVTPEKPGTFEFTCGMKMLKGRIVVR